MLDEDISAFLLCRQTNLIHPLLKSLLFGTGQHECQFHVVSN